MKISVALVGLVAVLQVPGACSVYDESLLSGGAGSGGGDASSQVCQSATWPLKPSGTNLGAGNDFYAALTMFDFGEDYGTEGPHAVARDIGYDIDSTCTAQTAEDQGLNPDPTMKDASSCEPPAIPGYPPRVGDLPQGRDNNLRALINLVQTVLPEFGTPSYNANIQTGRVSLLIGVTGYNGEADDDQITLTLYSPAEFNSVPENASKTPAFDGEDRWPVSSDSFLDKDTTRPKFVSSGGYVRNNTLVAAVPNLDLPLRIGISSQDVSLLQIRFISPFLTATIGRDPQSNLWKLTKGIIAARWKTDDLFDMLSRFPNPAIYPRRPGPGENPFFCASTPVYYPLIRNFICRTADIYSGGNSAATPCDSLSVGIGFEAVQARLGTLVDPPPVPPNPCGEADPSEDSCARAAQGLPPPGVVEDAGADGS